MYFKHILILIISSFLHFAFGLSAQAESDFPTRSYGLTEDVLDYVVEDFDGDGVNDLAYIAYGKDILFVKMGKSPGEFYPVEERPFLSFARSIEAGGVNNDGIIDIVAVISGGVRTLLGIGDGTFNEVISLDEPMWGGQLHLADLNNDSYLDAVVDTVDVRVYLGEGNGRFSEPFVIETDENHSELSIGDVAGDTELDIVVSISNGLYILVGLGNGDFEDVRVIDTDVATMFPDQLVLFDSDSNGKQEILVHNQQTIQSYSLELINDTLEVAEGIFLENARGLGNFKIVDLNNDEQMDIIIHHELFVDIYLGSPEGGFEEPSYYHASTYGPMRIVDFNLDGNLDLVQLSGSEDILVVTYGKGDGELYLENKYPPLLSYVERFLLEDINGDSQLDLITINDIEGKIYLGDGEGDFELDPFMSLTQTICAVGDLNGDTFKDIVVSDVFDLTISTLLNNGDGTFETAPPVDIFIPAGYSLLEDMNGDGKLDLVYVTFDAFNPNALNDSIVIMLGNGDGTFQTPTTEESLFSLGEHPNKIAIGDINNDEIPDVVSSNNSPPWSINIKRSW